MAGRCAGSWPSWEISAPGARGNRRPLRRRASESTARRGVIGVARRLRLGTVRRARAPRAGAGAQEPGDTLIETDFTMGPLERVRTQGWRAAVPSHARATCLSRPCGSSWEAGWAWLRTNLHHQLRTATRSRSTPAQRAGTSRPFARSPGARRGSRAERRHRRDTVNNDLRRQSDTAVLRDVYSRTASGNVAPLRTITGAATGLSDPRGIALDVVNNEVPWPTGPASRSPFFPDGLRQWRRHSPRFPAARRA